MPNTSVRPELLPLPERIADLPVDRGYPVPWFVDWVKGEDGNLIPEFRAMDIKKWVLAVRRRLCWVCGKALGANMAFLIGPMCGVNRTTGEPPCHLECAVWSACHCPFLSRPNMERRKMDCPMHVSGISIQRNPGVTLVWVTKHYTVFPDGAGGYLIEMGSAESISCWAEGVPATPDQIRESLSTGLPLLLALATTAEDTRDIESRAASLRQRLGI